MNILSLREYIYIIQYIIYKGIYIHILKFSFVIYSRTTFSSTNAGRIYRLNRKISTNRPNSTNDS